jgi:hypothetical protein
MTNTYKLIQVVNFPTRISNDKGMLIDHVYFWILRD